MFDNKNVPRIRVWPPSVNHMPGWSLRIEWTADEAAGEEGKRLDLGRACIEWKEGPLGLIWLKLWLAPYP